jgi:hypothetical protein
MPDEKQSTEDIRSVFRIRRCLLQSLYDYFKDFPYATIELVQIADDCNVMPRELNWNMVYLEKCGYVELAKSDAIPPFIAPAAVITSHGIDLIEDRMRFDKRFPLDKNEP